MEHFIFPLQPTQWAIMEGRSAGRLEDLFELLYQGVATILLWKLFLNSLSLWALTMISFQLAFWPSSLLGPFSLCWNFRSRKLIPPMKYLMFSCFSASCPRLVLQIKSIWFTVSVTYFLFSPFLPTCKISVRVDCWRNNFNMLWRSRTSEITDDTLKISKQI